ncbi:hypothetical protein EJB05_37737, partial [Eragrostis curvula]
MSRTEPALREPLQFKYGDLASLPRPERRRRLNAGDSGREGGLPAALYSIFPSPALQNPSTLDARLAGARGGGSEWGARVRPAGVADPMAAETGKRLMVDELLSYADDLVALLDGSKDGEDIAQATAGARMLRSACRSELDNLELQLKECQEKNRSCKEKIDKAKVETISDDELKPLQIIHKHYALNTAVRDELDNLDSQLASIEGRKDAVKRKEKEMRKAQNTLSMCVSVTKIMPNLEDKDKISGYIVDKNKKKIDTFEYEKTASPFEICNELWKKI